MLAKLTTEQQQTLATQDHYSGGRIERIDLATGNIAVTNPQGDVAYGDKIDLTDSLKDGVVDNMLVVLEKGGRLAARRGTRGENGRRLPPMHSTA